MSIPIICLINQKGGCGKSSTCFHLAGHFATTGKRVLLVDADPQGSLSQGFFGSELVENLPAQETLAAVFDETKFVSSPETICRKTPFDHITLVPANQFLAAHNTPEPENAGMRQFYLAEFLKTLSDFDLVLIDCPPNLYLCSWNALLAATHVVVPLNPEDFGAQGLRVVQQAITHAELLNPGLELLGHLITRVDRRLVIHRSYDEQLRRIYKDAVLETVVPEASAFKVATCCRQPVSYYAPRSVAAKTIEELGREIAGRIRPAELSERFA